MPQVFPTVLAWRAAAATAFSAMLADTLKLPANRLSVSLTTYPQTAAVSWNVYGHSDPSYSVTLYLPKMDLGATLTRKQADALAGYWVHEGGHVLYTPADGMSRNAYKGRGYCNLLNGCEDVRMEGETIKGAPTSNARSVLTAITRHVAAKGTTIADPVGNANEWKSLPWSVAYLGRAHVLGYDLGEPLRAYAATLNPVNRPLMAQILTRLKAARTFDDIEALADWILSDIHPAWDHGTKAQNPGDMGDDAPEGDKGEGDAEGDAEGDKGDASPEGDAKGDKGEGDAKGDKGEGDAKGDKGEGDAEGDKGEGDAEGDGNPTGDVASDGKGAGNNAPAADDMDSAEPSPDALADEINRNVSDRELDDQYSNASGNEAAAAAKPRAVPLDATDDGASYASIRDAFQGVHAVRAQVRRLFEAPENFGWDRHRERGRFDPQAAARVTWGAKDVFAVTEEAPGYSTAVQIMLDGSSSMGGPNMRAAVGMAAQIAEVAHAKSCPVQVDIFGVNTRSGYSLGLGRGALRISRVLPFGARMDPKTRARFCKAVTMPRGSTPLAAGIVHAGLSLDLATEPRRLLVVLTDGSNDDGWPPVAQAVKAVRARGMAVVALGLGVMEGSGDYDAFHRGFRQADAKATADGSHLAAQALRSIADALAGHHWGMTSPRAA